MEELPFIPQDESLVTCQIWFDDAPVWEQEKAIETFYTRLVNRAHTQAMLLRNINHIMVLMHGPYQVTFNLKPFTIKPREEKTNDVAA